MSTLTPLTLDQFREHIRTCATYRTPRALMLHHTENPDLAHWDGLSSMQAIRRWQIANNGAKDIQGNFYIDGEHIWTARPMDEANWAHAARIDLPWSKVSAHAKAVMGTDDLWMNKYAVGVETVGDFDCDDPATSPSMALAVKAFAAMADRWNIPPGMIFFHREVADKTCPGTRVTLPWFLAEVAAVSGEQTPEVTVTVGGKIVPCNAAIVNGKTAVDLGALLSVLAKRELHLWRDAPEGSSRALLRELAESFGWTLDTSAWPEVKLIPPA